MDLFPWLLCAVVIFFCVIAMRIDCARKIFQQHGLPIRWKDLILSYYHINCGCGHPSYYVDWIGAGATFKIYTLVSENFFGKPPYCHKCLREMSAICPCEKIILPGEKAAIVKALLAVNINQLKIILPQEIIICGECAEKLPEEYLVFLGEYAPLGPFPAITGAFSSQAANNIQPTHEAPVQLQ